MQAAHEVKAVLHVNAAIIRSSVQTELALGERAADLPRYVLDTGFTAAAHVVEQRRIGGTQPVRIMLMILQRCCYFSCRKQVGMHAIILERRVEGALIVTVVETSQPNR